MMKRLALIVGLSLFFIVTTHDLHAQSAENGKTVYQQQCVKCHGMKGEVSKYGKTLKPFPAKDLRSNLLSDKELRLIIKYGLYGRAMAEQKNKLTDKDIKDVIAYIRTLPYAPDIKHGKERFVSVCGPCHVNKKGMKLSGAVKLEKSALSGKEMAEVIRYGRHERPMLARKDSLSNVDIADILSYLLSIRN
jgi:cytochrome c oxidase cbb3-type subunit 3